MTEKKPRGRPPKEASEKRTEKLEIRLTPGEKAAIAKKAGTVTLSDWARDKLLDS